ncbi:MAG: hypothetical protein ACI9OJ_000865, partial [Myxococcota bacterium]
LYDDLLIVAINDSVVLASDARVNDQLETDGEHYIYDWTRIRGLNLMFQGDEAYCMGYGNGSDCALPQSDTTGEFLLSFAGELFEPIRQRALEDQRLELRFITVGDNDADTDCRHNGFRMRAVVDVALPGTFGEVVP